MQVDMSKVPNLEGRKEEERLFLAAQAAAQAYDDAEEERSEALRAKYDPLFEAAENEHAARVAEISRQRDEEMGLSELRAAHEAANNAYQASGGPRLDLDWDDQIQRCALSGLPLIVGDDILDGEDEKVLRCLVLPEREAEVAVDPEDRDAA